MSEEKQAYFMDNEVSRAEATELREMFQSRAFRLFEQAITDLRDEATAGSLGNPECPTESLQAAAGYYRGYSTVLDIKASLVTE
jgi:hypothetical protein